MTVFDCTETPHRVRIGDIVFDTYWRLGRHPRNSNGVTSHVGIVVDDSNPMSNQMVRVAHVGDHDFQADDVWNRPDAPKIHLLARLDSDEVDIETWSEILAARCLAIRTHAYLPKGADVRWVAAKRGYEVEREPLFRLRTTCIGFVHHVLEELGRVILDRNSIPLSNLHLSECCKKISEGYGIPEEPFPWYFVGYALWAMSSNDAPYSVRAPAENGLESPDFTYGNFVRAGVVRESACVDSHINMVKKPDVKPTKISKGSKQS